MQVKTHVYEELEKVITMLRKTIADKKQGMAVISANYGTGKTEAAKMLTKQYPDVYYMKISQTLDTPSKFTRELARVIGSAISRSYQETLDFLATYLEATGQNPIIILDEAQRLLSKRTLMGEIKDVFEEFPIRFVMLGDLDLLKHINRYPALNKRIIIRKSLSPLSEKTVKSLAEAYKIKTDETLLKIAKQRNWSTIEVDRLLYYAKGMKIETLTEKEINTLIKAVEVSL